MSYKVISIQPIGAELFTIREYKAALVIQKAVRETLDRLSRNPLHIKRIKGNIGFFGMLKEVNVGNVFSKILANVSVKKTIVSERSTSKDLQIMTLELFDTKDIPKEFVTYGRTNFHIDKNTPAQSVAVKYLREEESIEDLNREIQMLQLLNEKKADWKLRSTFPKPLGVVNVSPTQAIAYQTDPSYYKYVSTIEDENSFTEAMENTAHDLGVLLTKNIGFHQLFSMFHAEGRSYTCFPNLLGVQVMSAAPEFAGKMANIVGNPLYENIGLSGLRDVGDMVFLDEWTLPSGEIDFNASIQMGRLVLKSHTYSEVQKIMHFLSLYQLVFGIMIAKRAEMFECKDPKIWGNSARLFRGFSKKLLEGLDLKLSKNIAIDTQRFNEQIKFGFSKDRASFTLEEYVDEDLDDESFIVANPPTKPTQNQLHTIFGSGITWDTPFPGLRGSSVVYDPRDSGYSYEHGFGATGSLGSWSGPLPLLELMRSNYQFVAQVLETIYH